MRHSPPLHRKPPAKYCRSARLQHVATILGVLAISLACTQPSREGTIPGSGENVNAGKSLDENGVAKLFSSTPGVHFHLGKDNPNSAGNLQIERKTSALRRTDGALEYWNVTAHDLDYAFGGSGKTSRLHIYAGAGQQAYTWKTQKGFIATPSDIRNQEFTAFVRVHGVAVHPHTLLRPQVPRDGGGDWLVAHCFEVNWRGAVSLQPRALRARRPARIPKHDR